MKRLCRRISMLTVLAVTWPSLVAAAEPVVGEEAPGFSLTSLDGNSINLSDYRGKNVVIHFGAGW